MGAGGHRTPQPPPWFNTAPRGTCRWCNQPIDPELEPRRIHWHAACLDEFTPIFWPHAASRVAFERAGGVCQACGAVLGECLLGDQRMYPLSADGRQLYEFDHIIPLVDALPHADDPYWQWRDGNTQILCQDCHKAKTAAEATRRAYWRRRATSGQPWLPGLEAA